MRSISLELDSSFAGKKSNRSYNFETEPREFQDSKSAKFTEASAGERTYELCFLIKLVFTIGIGGFLFGYDTGVIAGAQLYLERDWPDITTSDIALIVSITMVGASIGALFSGAISDCIGRKPVIIFADFLFTGGSILMAYSPSITYLTVGRFIVGVAVGAASEIAPLYLSEVAPVQIRGKLVAFNNAMITFG